MSLVQTPESFNFTEPKAWLSALERALFLKYRVMHKLDEVSSEKQLNTLLYVIESEAKKIYSTFSFKKKDEEKNF